MTDIPDDRISGGPATSGATPLPQLPPRETKVFPGLVSYGRAISSRSKCFLCGDPIIETSWRLEYRPENGPRRWAHGECCHMLPGVSRTADYHAACQWITRRRTMTL